ncbi:uncharacterized protein JCM10292_005266 [Rhodotorula paludigena]|uniref:Uncharacterized protein n=1 Tax=Rhodotorula paludigena TaxID=86838 RepID=A0AAV5GRA7_9BASI|nr:hypothetical protein Rhopal_006114-T1 [Rhodotorula paludigena]
MAGDNEQQFKIQPHFPGSDAESTPGLGSAPNLAHLHQQDPTGGRGANPHIVDEKTASSLGPPKSRDELQRIQAQLNDEERPQMSRPNSSMEGNAGEL